MSILSGLSKGLSKKAAIAGGDINAAREIKLSPSERSFFEEVHGNEADRVELMEEVPSFKIKDGTVQVLEADLDKSKDYNKNCVKEFL